jgi:RNA-binding protein YlmH
MTLEERLAHLRDSGRPTILRFLNETEQAIVSAWIPSAQFDGGYPDAERKRAYLFGASAGDIVAYRIQPSSKRLELTHGAILGTLMSLQIERDTIGDILADEGIVFVTAELAKEIERSFTAINRVPIELKAIDGAQIRRTARFTEHQVVVSSLRLDTVVARIAGVPRTKAQEWIETERIQINHRIARKSTTLLHDGDILSIRSSGRYVLDDASRRTKKDNHVLQYRKYA